MELYCQDAELCGYADDTSITVKGRTLETVKEKCETEVKKILEYMAINKLLRGGRKKSGLRSILRE